MKNCPYCSEEIKDNAKKCKHCGSWLYRENPQRKINNTSYKKTLSHIVVPGIIILAICFILLVALFLDDTYTVDNWLSECEESQERGGGYANAEYVYKTYKCKNKAYTGVIEHSMIMSGINPGYNVFDGNKQIASIYYEYNFHQYICTYNWEQKEEYCTLSDFVSKLNRYKEFKENL